MANAINVNSEKLNNQPTSHTCAVGFFCYNGQMLSITAEKRSIFGKELKSERQAGKMPVIVYGDKKDATPLFVQTGEFKKLLAKAGESTVVTVKTESGDKDVLVQEVAWHPVTGEPLHADFYIVDKTKVLKINVPLNFSGVSPAVKDLAGILVKVIHELHVEVLPMDIPHEIEVDISKLINLDSQILVKDLKVNKEVKVLNNPDDVVAAISVAKEEVVEAAPVDLSSIEVEKKGKKEDEAGAEAPAGEEKTDEVKA